jgi:hypothetical protein
LDVSDTAARRVRVHSYIYIYIYICVNADLKKWINILRSDGHISVLHSIKTCEMFTFVSKYLLYWSLRIFALRIHNIC